MQCIWLVVHQLTQWCRNRGMQVGFVKNPGKICENPFKVPKNSGTDVSTPLFLIVWWMRLTDKTRLILTFFNLTFFRSYTKNCQCWRPQKTLRDLCYRKSVETNFDFKQRNKSIWIIYKSICFYNLQIITSAFTTYESKKAWNKGQLLRRVRYRKGLKTTVVE